MKEATKENPFPTVMSWLEVSTDEEIKAFLIDYFSGWENLFEDKTKLDIINKGDCTRTTKNGKFSSIVFGYYGSIEWSIFCLMYKPEHGASETIIMNQQIETIFKHLSYD